MTSLSLFPLGQILATPGALETLDQSRDNLALFLMWHSCGQWGDLCAEDRKANDDALSDGGRILSAYHLRSGVKLWIITEADRSATTALLPEEY